MALVHGGVDPGPVVGTVTRERGHRGHDLVEQGHDLGAIIHDAVSQRGGHDPAAGRIQAEVQFPPGPPLPGAVLLDQPLARPTQLQPGTVDQQVDRSTSRAGLRRQFQALSPPAEGCLIAPNPSSLC